MNANTQRILIAVLVLLFVGSAGQYWQTQQALEASRLEISQLRTKVEQLKRDVDTLQAHVKQLDKTSVQGIVREANSTLIDGWSSLMSTVENELVRAREAMQAQHGQSGQLAQPSAATGQSSPAQP